MKYLYSILIAFVLLFAGVKSQAAPVITFNVSDDSIVSPADVSYYDIPGLALVQFHVSDSLPLKQLTAQGFNESLSVWLGGNNGQATAGIFVYVPIFALYSPGEHDLTVTAVDAAGAKITRTLHLFLIPRSQD